MHELEDVGGRRVDVVHEDDGLPALGRRVPPQRLEDLVPELGERVDPVAPLPVLARPVELEVDGLLEPGLSFRFRSDSEG